MGDPRLDLSPLGQVLPPDAVTAYRRAVKARGGGPRSPGRTSLITIVVVAGVFVLLGLVLLPTGGRLLGFVLVVAGVGTAVLQLRRIVHPGDWSLWARLDRFAQANGMRFTPLRYGSDENGMIFGRGFDQVTSELMQLGDDWLEGRAEVANYRFSITTGNNRQQAKGTAVYPWAYLVLQLDRKLPQLVLDAVQNDQRTFRSGGADLPTRFDASQRLSLEGDFDRYFHLYVPKGYEQDALYVLTPDLMALLVDQAGKGAAFDVEIIDDRMYFYSPGHLDFGDPAVWQRLTTIVRTVGAKTLRQTDRYGDDRAADAAVDVVAPEGQRLQGARSSRVLRFVLFAISVGIVVYLGYSRLTGH